MKFALAALFMTAMATQEAPVSRLDDLNEEVESPARNKCILECTVGSIGEYWGCALLCVWKDEPNECITALCPASTVAFDVPCLKHCNAIDPNSTEEAKPIENTPQDVEISEESPTIGYEDVVELITSVI